MKPLIKWPGGKSREYKNIENLIPQNIKRYIEPFFGGGGIFFNLEPQEAAINDINANLIKLYKFLKEQNRDLESCLEQIADDWDNLSLIANDVFGDTKKYKDAISEDHIKNAVTKLSEDKNLPRLINGQEHYWELLSDILINKLNRIIDLEIKNGVFSEKDFYEQIVAVTKGAYYYYIRDRFIPKNDVEEVAQFFFLREYCFGSMFRFNSNGKFNIPYGGASYNNKSFHAKVDSAFSIPVKNLFKDTEIYSDDFRQFFKKISSKINTNDFCFFDPPYDTEFSDYEKQEFGKKEQESLANTFNGLQCKGLMIIKKTEYIYNLYSQLQKRNSNITIDEYGKNYSYNMKGRNERDVTHLLILNYQPPQSRLL